MSIDLNWDTLTGGPDGIALAERIRDFIHLKFQAVPLPRFIKSVTVHEFAFGNIPPKVVLKDICDPLPDFYEEDYDEDEEEEDVDADAEGIGMEERHGEGEEDVPDSIRAAERRRRNELNRTREDREGGSWDVRDGRGGRGGRDGRAGSGGESRSGPNTPFADGFFPPHVHSAGLRNAPGPSNMHYFQSKLGPGPGWSGAQTPLAAVAGAQHLNGWLESTSQQAYGHDHNADAGGYGHRHGQGGYGAQGAHGAHSVHSAQSAQSTHSTHSTRGRHGRHLSQGSISVGDLPSTLSVPAPPHTLREKHSVSTLAPTSAGASRPPTRDTRDTPGGGGGGAWAPSAPEERNANTQSRVSSNLPSPNCPPGQDQQARQKQQAQKPHQEPRTDDLQAVFRINYAGDVRLELTAEILLDYPMPSFVGIPVKLNITGLTFDGVGVVAYIRKRVHFCFLSPEDAIAAVGDEGGDGRDGGEDDGGEDDGGDEGDRERVRGDSRTTASSGLALGLGLGLGGIGADYPGHSHARNKGRMGGLLQEIRVESEIGLREGTKQSLKNVGKVEKFVLEQVRRIFEEEFVYPSFWTFLV